MPTFFSDTLQQEAALTLDLEQNKKVFRALYKKMKDDAARLQLLKYIDWAIWNTYYRLLEEKRNAEAKEFFQSHLHWLNKDRITKGISILEHQEKPKRKALRQARLDALKIQKALYQAKLKKLETQDKEYVKPTQRIIVPGTRGGELITKTLRLFTGSEAAVFGAKPFRLFLSGIFAALEFRNTYYQKEKKHRKFILKTTSLMATAAFAGIGLNAAIAAKLLFDASVSFATGVFGAMIVASGLSCIVQLVPVIRDTVLRNRTQQEINTVLKNHAQQEIDAVLKDSMLNNRALKEIDTALNDIKENNKSLAYVVKQKTTKFNKEYLETKKAEQLDKDLEAHKNSEKLSRKLEEYKAAKQELENLKELSDELRRHERKRIFSYISLAGAVIGLCGLWCPPLAVVGSFMLCVTAVVDSWDQSHNNRFSKWLREKISKFFGKTPAATKEVPPAQVVEPAVVSAPVAAPAEAPASTPTEVVAAAAVASIGTKEIPSVQVAKSAVVSAPVAAPTPTEAPAPIEASASTPAPLHVDIPANASPAASPSPQAANNDVLENAEKHRTPLRRASVPDLRKWLLGKNEKDLISAYERFENEGSYRKQVSPYSDYLFLPAAAKADRASLPKASSPTASPVSSPEASPTASPLPEASRTPHQSLTPSMQLH